MTFRKDINGLRAIAVAAVVIRMMEGSNAHLLVASNLIKVALLLAAVDTLVRTMVKKSWQLSLLHSTQQCCRQIIQRLLQ